ncbi:RuvC-like resolvase [Mycobacterium phage Funsized]|nr:RuvC-like resolvase [Mycobacterium phage Funsized]
MRVLGIDTSLTGTGLAQFDLATWPPSNPPRQPDEPVSFGLQVARVCAPKPTADKSKRAMARRVKALIEQIEWCFKTPGETPDHVGIEGLAYTAGNASAWVLAWVWGETIALCEEYQVPLTVVAPAARAKFATGKGNAAKDAVLAAAIKLFPHADISDNNEGDAAIVGAVVCQQLGVPVLPVTSYRTEVMAKLSD